MFSIFSLHNVFGDGERDSGYRRVIRMWLLVLVNLILGIAFGFFHKGAESYRDILRNGAIGGVIISVVLLGLSTVLLPDEIASGFGIVGVFGFLVLILVFVVIFVIGAFAGDKLEHVIRK